MFPFSFYGDGCQIIKMTKKQAPPMQNIRKTEALLLRWWENNSTVSIFTAVNVIFCCLLILCFHFRMSKTHLPPRSLWMTFSLLRMRNSLRVRSAQPALYWLKCKMHFQSFTAKCEHGRQNKLFKIECARNIAPFWSLAGLCWKEHEFKMRKY